MNMNMHGFTTQEVLDAAQNMAESIWALASYCAPQGPAPVPVCVSFWVAVIWACGIFSALMTAWVAYSIWSYRKKWREALAAEAKRNAVNHEEIEALKAPWEGEPEKADRWEAMRAREREVGHGG